MTKVTLESRGKRLLRGEMFEAYRILDKRGGFARTFEAREIVGIYFARIRNPAQSLFSPSSAATL
jgi:hypothetical protein